MCVYCVEILGEGKGHASTWGILMRENWCGAGKKKKCFHMIEILGRPSHANATDATPTNFQYFTAKLPYQNPFSSLTNT